MPNRILREGIIDSDSVNSLSWEAEIFYRRLMSVVDDFGCFDGRVSILKGRLYALKSRVRESDISSWIAECVKAGLIAVYEHDFKPYLLFHKLGEPRAQKSKYPKPPAGLAERLNAKGIECSTLIDGELEDTHLRANDFSRSQKLANVPPTYSPTDTPTPIEFEKDTRESARPPNPLFDRFWKAYPRKTAKPNAVKAFAKLNPDEPLVDAMLAAIEWQAKQDAWQAESGRFIPHPATWLNARRWEDEKIPESTATAKPTRTFRQADRDDAAAMEAALKAHAIDAPRRLAELPAGNPSGVFA